MKIKGRYNALFVRCTTRLLPASVICPLSVHSDTTMTHIDLANAPLGHAVNYPKTYDASVLFAIERANNRANLGPLPDWHGSDIWTAYELSWLNPKGKPVVAMGLFTVPHNTPRLIESKSFKLYLNSFNESRFDSLEQVISIMQKDLEAACGGPMGIKITPLQPGQTELCAALSGESIDDQDVEITHYHPTPGLLRCDPTRTATEALTSDLLKSNCPVTGQPDWGSVQITYTGPKIDRAALLQYIVSLRQHNEFHEHCVETLFCDIWRECKPVALTVYARYTRRGGLDINPWRSSHPVELAAQRTPRQ